MLDARSACRETSLPGPCWNQTHYLYLHMYLSMYLSIHVRGSKALNQKCLAPSVLTAPYKETQSRHSICTWTLRAYECVYCVFTWLPGYKHDTAFVVPMLTTVVFLPPEGVVIQNLSSRTLRRHISRVEACDAVPLVIVGVSGTAKLNSLIAEVVITAASAKPCLPWCIRQAIRRAPNSPK